MLARAFCLKVENEGEAAGLPQSGDRIIAAEYYLQPSQVELW